MAIAAGTAAFAAAEAQHHDLRWLVHSGIGPQGALGWPVYHHIQNGIVGRHGNAFEIRKNCAGGLTSWLLATRLLIADGVTMCTGADNWSWSDRFVNSRTSGGEPLSDAAHATVVGDRGGFAKVLGSATASSPGQTDAWRMRDEFWQTTTADAFGRAYAEATSARPPEAIRESLAMFTSAITGALEDAGVSPQYVTHFVPHNSDNGQPYRFLARRVGLPWSEDLHQHNLDRGYLGVSTQAEGMAFLAETGCLSTDSIVLLLAAEYHTSATAMVLRIKRAPRVRTDGMVRVVS
jgi:3-oxoacyl-[acyl-carrier-protein] synthase III